METDGSRGEWKALKSWLVSMQRGLHTVGSPLDSIRDKRARDRESVVGNVLAQLEVIRRNSVSACMPEYQCSGCSVSVNALVL